MLPKFFEMGSEPKNFAFLFSVNQLKTGMIQEVSYKRVFNIGPNGSILRQIDHFRIRIRQCFINTARLELILQ